MASGYIVHQDMMEELLNCFELSLEKLSQSILNESITVTDYYFDVFWTRLQPFTRWYAIDPRLGVQRESFSDIQNRVVDYKR
jgi:hypothetical protein